MSKQKEQIKALLDEHGITIESVFVPFSRSRNAGEIPASALAAERRFTRRLSARKRSSRTGSAAEADLALAALAQAKRDLELLLQQEAQLRNQLLGEPDLPLEMYPPSIQAAAALAQARRDLDHTIVRAPIAGRATQVDAIQLGRYVSAGTPVFSIIDDAHPWVDANPKETDITHLQLGQKAFVYVDTFPGHTLHGTVTSVSPGTGAQFAILPPQNASGNWVKVVQRVPVRITFNPGQSLHGLRAGMSATVEIDTRRRRTLASPFGESAAAKDD